MLTNAARLILEPSNYVKDTGAVLLCVYTPLTCAPEGLTHGVVIWSTSLAAMTCFFSLLCQLLARGLIQDVSTAGHSAPTYLVRMPLLCLGAHLEPEDASGSPRANVPRPAAHSASPFHLHSSKWRQTHSGRSNLLLASPDFLASPSCTSTPTTIMFTGCNILPAPLPCPVYSGLQNQQFSLNSPVGNYSNGQRRGHNERKQIKWQNRRVTGTEKVGESNLGAWPLRSRVSGEWHFSMWLAYGANCGGSMGELGAGNQRRSGWLRQSLHRKGRPGEAGGWYRCQSLAKSAICHRELAKPHRPNQAGRAAGDLWWPLIICWEPSFQYGRFSTVAGHSYWRGKRPQKLKAVYISNIIALESLVYLFTWPVKIWTHFLFFFLTFVSFSRQQIYDETHTVLSPC